jgi:hypothetical protein
MWEIYYDVTEGKDIVIHSSDWRPGKLLNQHFRLLDDDGEPYYLGASNDSDSEEAFAPLDDYGTPNAGCTEIQYLRNNEWKTL